MTGLLGFVPSEGKLQDVEYDGRGHGRMTSHFHNECQVVAEV